MLGPTPVLGPCNLSLHSSRNIWLALSEMWVNRNAFSGVAYIPAGGDVVASSEFVKWLPAARSSGLMAKGNSAVSLGPFRIPLKESSWGEGGFSHSRGAMKVRAMVAGMLPQV